MSAPPPRPQSSAGFVADLASPPNLITLSRLALIVMAAVLFFADHRSLGLGLAVVAGLTDYLDGWVARRTGQVTRLGEMLDHFSDIFFESLVLTITIAVFHFLPLWVLPVYLARELWVTTIRRFMAHHQVNITSNLVGKLKTNFVMWGFLPTYLSILGVLPAFEPGLGHLGRGAILVGLAFGYLSGWSYTRQMIAAYDQLAAAGVRLAAAGALGAASTPPPADPVTSPSGRERPETS